MLKLNAQIEIDAPADEVWQKLAKLDDVQHWVESVKSSHYSSGQTEGVGAQRICEVDGFGTLHETITDWQDGKALTYGVEGMPRIVRKAESTWSVEAITPEKTRVTVQSELETRYGVFGAMFAKSMMKPQLTRFLQSALTSFKDFTEHSTDTHEPTAAPLHAQVA